MKLKFIITNESELPEDETLKKLYTKQGDKWVMDIEGAVPKTQLDEFRNNNTELKKQLDVFKIDGKPVTADEFKAVMDKKAEFEAGTSPEKINALVEKRVGEMKQAHQTELAAEREKVTKLTGDLESHVIDRALIEAGSEHGLRATAHEDLIFRGRQQFKIDEHGKPVAKDKDGNILYNKAGDPLGAKDFVATLVTTASHLFEPSGGSGAGGSGDGNKGTTNKNPWAKDSFNVTDQSAIYKKDPNQARQLAAQAGVKI